MNRVAPFLLAATFVMPSNASDVLPQATVELTENPAPYVALGKLIVALETTTFKDLTATVKSTLIESGEKALQDQGAGDICFAYANTEIHFIAGIMSGRDQFTHFTIEAVKNLDVRCSSLPAVFQPARAGGWLEIGTSREVVERRFKAAPGNSKDTVRYTFGGSVPSSMCAVEGLGFLGELDVTYAAGKVARIAGRQVTSC